MANLTELGVDNPCVKQAFRCIGEHPNTTTLFGGTEKIKKFWNIISKQ
jgi:hypothetical protein